MNILIIGGTGFLGTGISNLLSIENNVTAIGKKSNLLNMEIEQIDIELKNINHIKKIILDKEINCIIHLANLMLPSSGLADFKKNIDEIYLPTIELIDFFEETTNGKFVFFSSGGTIYGNSSMTEEFNSPTPINYYGYSKLIIEEYLCLKERSGMNILILRPSNPYGPGQNILGKQGIIAVSFGKLFAQESLQIFSAMEDTKNYIYIDDFTELSVKLIEHKSGIFNIGSKKDSTILEIIKSINNVSANKLLYEQVGKKDKIVHSFHLDISKLIEEFPDYKYTSLEEGIGKFYDFLKEENNDIGSRK